MISGKKLAMAILAALAMAGGARAAVVDTDGRITIIDHGYRDWPAELLEYELGDRTLKDGPAHLADADGKAIPAQVEDGRLLFVAGLARGETATFTLGDGRPAASTLRVAARRRLVEAGNEHFTLRLPPVGRQAFRAPRPATDVPGPINAWQPSGGPWMGASRFVTDRQVDTIETRILRNGPAVFEYEARYRFVPDGEYVCRIRICPGVDRADIVEEFDFGTITAGQDFLLLELAAGFAPSTLGWVAGEGGQIARAPYAEAVAAKLRESENPPAPVGGAGATPLPPIPEPGLALMDKILAGGRWGGTKGGVEVRGEADTPDTAPAARAALAPMRVGNWRRAMALTVWAKPKASVLVALPISVRPVTWYAEVTDDISPFSTHEHDPELPESYGRREWALYFGENPHTVQRTAGYIGLNEYKEWVLDWPETVAADAYPRAWFTKADIAELKASLDRHPDREALERHYVFSGNSEDAVRQARGFINEIGNQHASSLGNWSVPGLSHYRQSQFLGGAYRADDALACPELPADLRREVRRTLAVSAYLLSHPDLNPRGAGVHLGNNNMSINRTCALAYFAGLLPDHPRYDEWMGQIAAHVAYKLESQVAWDGAAIECPTYWLYGPLRFLEPAIAIIHNTGGPDLGLPQARSVGYFAHLSMADARFNGRRIIPGMGNGGNTLESLFGATLATVVRALPELAPLAQRLHRAAWPTQQLAGTPATGIAAAFQYRPDVPETPATLETTFMPTYGVAFRNHFGTPDETALLFRAGINWSHWDTDIGNVILYGAGDVPLSPGTGYQYYYGPATQNEAIYHNRVKVGARDLQEVFGRVDAAIVDYGFGPGADYAVNSRFYPSQLFADGQGAMRWNRHVMFLKDAQPGGDYFVLRDSFPGGAGRPTWWTWLNLGHADAIRVDGQPFDKETTPFDKVVPESEFPSRAGRILELATPFGAGTWMGFVNREPPTFRARMTFTAGNSGLLGLRADEFPLQSGSETKTIVEAVASPGEDYFYAVVPRRDGTPAPQVERFGGHGMKITTPRSTDHVFVADEPIAVEAGDIVFSGKAGAVRVYPDRVTLCLNAGSGRVGYKGMIFEGHAPFERTVALAALVPGVTVVPSTPKTRERIELDGDIVVEGEGSVQARLDGEKIVIETDGRARVLYVTRPEWIRRPWMTVNGEASMACWTDYPASGWGSYDRTHLIGVPVPEGAHVIELTDTRFPDPWPRRFRPSLRDMNHE